MATNLLLLVAQMGLLLLTSLLQTSLWYLDSYLRKLFLQSSAISVKNLHARILAYSMLTYYAVLVHSWRDVKVYEGHAYIGSEALDHGLQVSYHWCSSY